MNKEKLLKRLKDISTELDTNTEADIEALEKEMREIQANLSRIELREKTLAAIKAGELEGRHKEDDEDQTPPPPPTTLKTTKHRSAPSVNYNSF